LRMKFQISAVLNQVAAADGKDARVLKI